MNNDLDFLDSVSVECEAAESKTGFVQHPCGSYAALVEGHTMKVIPSGSPVWELTIKTAHGIAQHSCWGFSSDDIQQARSSQTSRDRMMGTIARHKRLFVDLGVWTAEEAKGKTWSLISTSWDLLTGKSCQLVVKPDHKKPGYTLTYVNAPTDHPDIVGKALTPEPKSSTSGRMPPRDDFSDIQPSTRRAPSAQADQGGIPF